MAHLNDTHIKGNLTVDGRIIKPSGFVKFNNGNASQIVNSSNSPSRSITIITRGRPVMASVSGCINPTTDTAWLWINLDRINEVTKEEFHLARQIAESWGNSCNTMFGINYLDNPPAGRYTYKVTFTLGNGTIDLAEQALKDPNFSVWEV